MLPNNRSKATAVCSGCATEPDRVWKTLPVTTTSHQMPQQNRTNATAVCLERATEADKAWNPLPVTTTSHQMLQQNRTNAIAVCIEQFATVADIKEPLLTPLFGNAGSAIASIRISNGIRLHHH
jgi:hypothetical protein